MRFSRQPKEMLLFFELLFLLTRFVAGEESFSEIKSRVKRKVVFSKNSKLFFRLNGKDNIVPWNQIFAHGWTLRINYDLPENLQKRHKFFKRDIHEEIRSAGDGQSLKGFSCVLKHLCEKAMQIKAAQNCGFFCEIGKIISRHEGIEADFFKSFLKKCEHYREECPDLTLPDDFIHHVDL